MEEENLCFLSQLKFTFLCTFDFFAALFTFSFQSRFYFLSTKGLFLVYSDDEPMG